MYVWIEYMYATDADCEILNAKCLFGVFQIGIKNRMKQRRCEFLIYV